MKNDFFVIISAFSLEKRTLEIKLIFAILSKKQKKRMVQKMKMMNEYMVGYEKNYVGRQAFRRERSFPTTFAICLPKPTIRFIRILCARQIFWVNPV